jgi:hypothetical protein
MATDPDINQIVEAIREQDDETDRADLTLALQRHFEPAEAATDAPTDNE